MQEKDKFLVVYQAQATEFLQALPQPCRRILLLRISYAQRMDTNDPQAFKKLDKHIWEFRARCEQGQVRLLAFWDKRKPQNTLVVCCRGFIKKQSAVPQREIERAHRLREDYFNEKSESQ